MSTGTLEPTATETATDNITDTPAATDTETATPEILTATPTAVPGTDLAEVNASAWSSGSETAATKPSFRDAWKWARHCIVPAESIFEPDWRSGKAIATRIKRSDGQPMGLAGLFAWWKDDKGTEIFSFTLLTINATDHALMNQFHKPADEKRMVVILPEESYGPWLNAKPEDSMDFMRPYPADRLTAEAPAMA